MKISTIFTANVGDILENRATGKPSKVIYVDDKKCNTQPGEWVFLGGEKVFYPSQTQGFTIRPWHRCWKYMKPVSIL